MFKLFYILRHKQYQGSKNENFKDFSASSQEQIYTWKKNQKLKTPLGAIGVPDWLAALIFLLGKQA